MIAVGLDRHLVDEYISGNLDAAGEAALKEQVARLLPFRWALPNSAAAAVTVLTKHLGGVPALYAWLDQQPGLPRLAARAYPLVDLLDRISDRPAVIAALTQVRGRTGDPPGLQGYLVPDTTAETLASLGQLIESLLADDSGDDARRVALSTIGLLERLAPRVEEQDPELAGLGREVARIRQALREASAGCDRPEG
jgi:hypothetical protein